MIDEKELTDISTVIELTKWVKEGNVVPYFLWCLRDFMLDITGYNDADDYLEKILSTKDYDQKDEKYRIRKNMNEFFRDRNCLFFIRPVNDEKKLQVIETLKPTEIRKEFNESLEKFKNIIFSHLRPKRVNERVLNGSAFVYLIKDILNAFNSKKVPEITSSIERIFENERRELLEATKSYIDAFIKENIDMDDLCRIGTENVWTRITEKAAHRQDYELPVAIFGECLKHFYIRFDQEKTNKGQKFFREIEVLIEDLINEPDFQMDNMLANVKMFFVEKNCLEKEIPIRFVHDKIISKVFRKVSIFIHDIEKANKHELEEKEKDIEAEKEKRKLDKKLLFEQKQNIADYQNKINSLEITVKNKVGEISDLKKIDNNEQALLNQLTLNRERIEELENENRILREVISLENSIKTTNWKY